MKRPDLRRYKEKRDFTVTPEPPPRPVPGSEGPPTFMVHKHDARRLHYDLRLEMDGALASWAIPKGPSYDPAVRRLAVQTEDHPLEYGGFEGRIPDGEYGGGDSIIWDHGVYDTVPPGQASAMRKKGHVEFVMEGEKLHGRWHLVRTAAGAPGKAQWILFKARDEHVSTTYDVVAERPESVISGRRITRGPIRAEVREGRGEPLRLLLGVWPPMMAAGRESSAAAAGTTHLLEAYGDGVRAIASVSHGRVVLQTEDGRDLAAINGEAVRALAALASFETVIDGELQDNRFVAHDLLWLDGNDVRGRPIEERREMLTETVRQADIVIAPIVDGPAARALRAVSSKGFTRLVAKRKGSPYVSGRSRDQVELAQAAVKTKARPTAQARTKAKAKAKPVGKPKSKAPAKVRPRAKTTARTAAKGKRRAAAR